MRVLNADGSTAEMCGNGIRCVAKYLVDHAGAPARLTIETEAGRLECQTLPGRDRTVSEVTVDMGRPELSPSRIPIEANGDRFVRGSLEFRGEALTGTAVSFGNPHFVLFGMDRGRLRELGPLIEKHPRFPKGTNVEFANASDSGLRVDVWERGCGITEACGTGACAVATAAVLEGRMPADQEIRITLSGGDLWIEVAADLSRVRMRGPATEVYRGELEVP